MAGKERGPGFFFSFEGGEGSGKSTQAKLLHAFLKGRGIPCVLTREPGGTSLGQKIREILLDKAHGHLTQRAELLLYEADRAQNVEELIRPVLKKGGVVVSDRYADSSTVYQGWCRGLGMKEVETLNRYATAGLAPDCVVLLDIPAEAGMARVQARAAQGAVLDRMEAEAAEFHKKVRSGFLKLARQRPSRYAVFDARKEASTLELAIREMALGKLRRRGIWKN